MVVVVLVLLVAQQVVLALPAILIAVSLVLAVRGVPQLGFPKLAAAITVDLQAAVAAGDSAQLVMLWRVAAVDLLL